MFHHRLTSSGGTWHIQCNRCIVLRASRLQLTVQIPPSQLQTFQSTYSNLLKSSLAPSMRKRDKKREKAKAEAVLKKRKEAYVDVVIGDAGKRGAGRRQRVSGSFDVSRDVGGSLVYLASSAFGRGVRGGTKCYVSRGRGTALFH
jgi:hypothetical protein